MEKKLSSYKLICVFILTLVLGLGYYALLHINFKAVSGGFYLGMLFVSVCLVIIIVLHLVQMQRHKTVQHYLNLYFIWFKYVWMCFIFLGLCLIAFNPNLNLWKGIGAALFLDSALMLFADFYGSTIFKR